MKKYMVLCTGLCLAMAFTSCKSSESAYKKAYEKAKSQEVTQQPVYTTPQETPQVVAPPTVQTQPDTRTYDNTDNAQVRQERVSLISGNGLRNYSVVVGSFGLKTNAEGLVQRLRDAGYSAQIVKNEDRNLYRVVASTFDSKADAVRSRDQFRATYPDAWLLYNVR